MADTPRRRSGSGRNGVAEFRGDGVGMAVAKAACMQPFVSRWPDPKPRSRRPPPASTACQWLCLLLAAAVAFAWFRQPAAVTACEGRLVCGRPLDVNYASRQELELLDGVGPATSTRIVQARPYPTVEDLLRVRGIGPKTLERLRPWVGVIREPPPPPPPPAPIDPNTATQQHLESLPTIGPVLAARIVKGRPYQGVEDLLRVRGIGPKTLATIKPRLGFPAREEAP